MSLQNAPVYVPSGPEVEVFESCFKTQTPLLLKGPTGCGKSQLVEFMAAKLSRPLIKVACNEDTNASDLLGRFLLLGGETRWQDGPVTRAVRSGAILYLDELAEAREDVIVAVHPLADHRREVYLDKTVELVKAPPEFMLVASFNPGYQRGLKELKPSTRQRFVTVAMDYLPLEQEAQLLTQLTGLVPSDAKALCRFAGKIRSMGELSLKETVSTRLLVQTAQLARVGMPLRRAATVGIAESLSDDREVVQAIREMAELSF